MLYNILRGDIRDEYLLSEIKIEVSRTCSRTTKTFWIQRGRTKILEHEVMDRTCGLNSFLTFALSEYFLRIMASKNLKHESSHLSIHFSVIIMDH